MAAGSDDELKRVSSELIALEAKAEITNEVKRAEEGRFIPLGALGDPCTPDEYFADEYDYTRRRIRNAYFSVAEIALRRQMIKGRRELADIHKRDLDGDVAKARAQLAQAQKAGRQLPWVTAAVVGVIAVAIGYRIAGTVGAIGGAVAALFLGQGTIHNAKASQAEAIAAAQEDLDGWLETAASVTGRPPYFSAHEMLTGERDEELDQMSAYVDELQKSARATGA